ncbi:MAG: hypothetical protein PWR01_3279 [Clostridiales bacterium]|nr:hypothetical protein [Clostridiales bacterium]MDN5282206.1 hypothetical protein [Candidatus Ozemobacter sp.]
MKLALFDFDGTITTHDSYREFLRFIVGTRKLILGSLLLSPWLLGYKIGLIKNYHAKQVVTSWFLKGMSKEAFETKAAEFVQKKLNSMIRPAAMKKILWHYQQSHRIIVVSASFEDYLAVWCRQHQLEVIGTCLEWQNDQLTGNFATPNCYGPEKVRRIKQKLNPEDYEEVFAYGDTRGDYEMLEMADHKGYRIF